MLHRTNSGADFGARLSFWLLVVFLVVIWFAGGASRADVSGQVITRLWAWMTLIVYSLLSPSFEWRSVRPVLVLLGLSGALVGMQLVPLPPGIWGSLPGRDLLVLVSQASGLPQPWRPISVSPGATINAFNSLVVALVVLVLAANLTRDQHWQLVSALLLMIFAACVLAIFQFAGAQFSNPFVNVVRGAVSGNFANRNHFALYVALACVLAPAWGFQRHTRAHWKLLFGIAGLPFFLLVVLATGSRAGLIVSCIGVVMGLLILRKDIGTRLRRLPRFVAISISVGGAALLAVAVYFSITLGRAASVDRMLDLRAADDLRAQALPYVFDAVLKYFPVGAGFGTFDPVYRIIEPDMLLQPNYFNHAHNDWIEIALEGGAPAIILAVAALAWWATKSLRAWRAGGSDAILQRAASVVLFLVFFASIVDYPVRTPTMMAIVVLAAVWLSLPIRRVRTEELSPTLPPTFGNL